MSVMKRGKKHRGREVIERVPAGIPGFDKLIEGGFEKNSTNLVVGSTGSGKTIFTVQFLIQGIRCGENVLYITFEEKKEEFYKNMARFGWHLREYEKKGKFVFLEYSPEKVKLMLEEGGGTIEAIVSKKKIKRLVIDSITSFALLFEHELEKREAALSLFSLIKKWNCTSLLTLQEDPMQRDGASTSIEFEADSIILLYFVRLGMRRHRFIEILKMRGTDHSKEIHPFVIGKHGIEVGSANTRLAKKFSSQLTPPLIQKE